MRIIQKKLHPKYYDSVLRRMKNFELRKDEDDIQVGDTIIFKEYDEEYTGREFGRIVRYVLRNYEGLRSGYCIIGF